MYPEGNNHSSIFNCITCAGAGAILGAIVGAILLPGGGVMLGAQLGGLLGSGAGIGSDNA